MLTKKYKKYIGYTFVLTLALTFLIFILSSHNLDRLLNGDELKPFTSGRAFRKGPGNRLFGTSLRLFSNFVLNCVPTLISSLILLIRQNKIKENETAALLNSNLQQELKYLKSQINPHFLFNSLNNVYALALSNSKDTANTILQLSSLLRYNLYDSKESSVPIEKEVEYLENYIEFEKLKDEDVANVQTQYAGCQNFKVPPLLFLPFVENSFKFARLDLEREGWIKLSITKKEQYVIMDLQNTIGSTQPSHNGGLGINNSKRRLSLLYDNDFDLKYGSKGGIFSVQLKIRAWD